MVYPPGWGSFKVTLLDERGRPVNQVNIMTQPGADLFIGSGTSAFYISGNLETANKIRARLNSMSCYERSTALEKLEQTYIMMDCISECATPAVFARVPTTELKCLVDHAIKVFSDLTSDPKWTKTGVLTKYDQQLLDCLISNCMHANFVKEVVNKSSSNSTSSSNLLLSVLAKFVAARKVGMPCADVAESIVMIVNNYRATLMLGGADAKEWPAEKVFKAIANANMLGQLIRCLSQPSPENRATESYTVLLDELAKCTMLIKKKLGSGEPAGVILKNVLARQDGFTGRQEEEEVMTRLHNLAEMSALNVEIKATAPGNVGVGQVCRYCNKAHLSKTFQEKLQLCSRCKNTYYCSKGCQRADWKVHKGTCEPYDRQIRKASDGLQSSALNFVKKNYYDIMKQLEFASRDGKVGKQDLLLEIDLKVDPMKGSAPGLRTPPEFKVQPTKGYIDGKRPLEPDWFFKGTDVYQDNISTVLSGLRDQYARMADDRLLTFVRHPSGTSSIYRMCFQSEETGMAMFSQQTLDAFRRSIVHGDDGLLASVYAPSQIQSIVRRRDFERGRQDMAALAQRCRDMMNSEEWRNIQDEASGSDDDDNDEEDSE